MIGPLERKALKIAQARARKIKRLLAELLALQIDKGEYLSVEQLTRAIEQMSDDWWRRLAVRAQVRAPSHVTRELVLEQVRDGFGCLPNRRAS